MKIQFLFISLFFVFIQCEQKHARFVSVSSDDTGVTFQNEVVESPEINILQYEYTYNGGGVAIADFNNDGLVDIYFTGNSVPNKLYLNKGNLKFEDITERAGVTGRKLWKTGVTAADVNADGWMDLYVCYSGPQLNQSLSNELYINNGIAGEIPTFTERGAEYGLDAPGTYSTQASFFDYDRDGDLDMMLINHGTHFYSPFINTNKLRTMRHEQFGNRLYRNEKDSTNEQQPLFKEVSDQAGIHGGGINFGLGISVSDMNNDGWPDIFVTNDYEEQDFLYLNNQDGTFSDVTKKSFGHISRNGMGTDVADYNNDGRTDLIEVDMWPEDNYRQKLLRGPDDYNRYLLMLDSGFHHQQMRNTLQLNAINAESNVPLFCEIGQIAGVAATDWSWAPLFADFDNDGNKDLFVTNGYLRDFTSMDFLKYTVEDARKKAREEGAALDLYELVGKMPSTKTPDYLYRNNGDKTFTNVTGTWGMDVPNLSFGCAYADLDNDGDLDIVTNNTNESAAIWRNTTQDQDKQNFIQVMLHGAEGNRNGIGSKVYVTAGSVTQMIEQYPTRGYQSSVDYRLHFGLGTNNQVTELKVIWPDGKISVLNALKLNQLVTVEHENSFTETEIDPTSNKLFSNVTSKSSIDFVHRENEVHDFDREPLMPYQLSRTGPALASADVNNDGQDDFYIGGASGQAGQLYLAVGDGQYVAASAQPWTGHKEREDTGAIFFDVDSDDDLDLFVVSGGNEHEIGTAMLDDRLYINDGNGVFSNAPPESTITDHTSGSCVTAADYDKDGDTDLFVGGRGLPGSFPLNNPGAILRNDTDRSTRTIKFTVATRELNEALREPGMVTDAIWSDFNQDSWPDLIIVGEWMPVRFFQNDAGKKFSEVLPDGLKQSNGLWKRIIRFDIDKDGDDDYIVGNAGLNIPWTVSADEPLILYYGDFDGDKRIDPIITYTQKGKHYPVASRDELLSQLTYLRKNYVTYDSYGKATITDILSQEKLEKSQELIVQTTKSVVIYNHGKGVFKLSDLPVEAQFSAATAIACSDYNDDGYNDLLIAGNYYPYRTQYGPSDASMGIVLQGTAKGNFVALPPAQSGLIATGDIRNLVVLNGNDNQYILFARNNDTIYLIETGNTKQL